MNRLLYVMPYTPNIEGMKKFYRDSIGLKMRHESPFFVDFESGRQGAALALLAILPSQRQEIELCFESDDVEGDFKALKGRGVEFFDEPRKQEFGTVVHLRDLDGHLISLLKPSPGLGIARAPATAKDDPAWRAGTAGAIAASAKASPTALATAVENPRFSAPILYCKDIALSKLFFRDKLGLKLETDSPSSVVFELGPSSLELHAYEDGEPQPGRALALSFTVGDLMAWADEARERGVHFESVPTDQGSGLAADTTDPEGNELIFREPAPPPALEEELAEAFEDDKSPQHAAMRKPVKKGVRAVSRVVLKPEYKTAGAKPKKPARMGAAKKRGLRVHSVRGAGPERSRMTPKNLADPKRARSRPALGRLKKAEARSATRKKTAVASASKGKPIKRAAAARGKARGRKR